MKQKTILLILIFCLFSIFFYGKSDKTIDRKASSPKMVIKGNFIKYFTIDPVSTEYNACRELVKKPLDVTVAYYATPWALLINSNNLDKVPTFKLSGGGFTICQHIDFEKIIPLLEQRGIDTLFTPHAVKGKDYGNVRVLPFPHYAVHGKGPAEIKNIWYSFIGSDTHPTRRMLFEISHPKDTVIIQRDIWHFASENKEQEKIEYQDVLSRSRFSLCPRGTGPSTIRFWESLQAGAIPVLIGTDMWLPEEFDWSSCVVIIQEKEVRQIPDILRRISTDQEKLMRQSCIEAYQKFSGSNLVSSIRFLYEQH
jgi:hypothetical protein